MSDPTTARTWGQKVKQATAAIPLSKVDKKDRGTRHIGVIDNIELVSFKTGSLGLKIKYVIEGMERAAYENLVLRMPDAEGNLVNTQYGEANLKRRLQAAGLTADQINAFPFPKTVKDETAKAILSTLKGAEVAVYLRTREYQGKPQLDVASVFPVDRE